MTLLTTFAIAPPVRGSMVAPCALLPEEVTMVIPVKDNQSDVLRLLNACLNVFPPRQGAAEIIIVDNNSCPPVTVSAHLASRLPVRVVCCTHPGAAAARNRGIQQAHTPWVLFLDSDCLPTTALLDGYRQALNGAIAYAGTVSAEQHDLLSCYYESQHILFPPPLLDNGVARPTYLITANALVWREALTRVGGFDERFPSAGGEDIDLGLRLWGVGPLAYAPEAHVVHRFEPDVRAFLRRFVRYGRGNRLLAARYQTDLMPRPFAPYAHSLVNRFLASAQWLALWWGYISARPARSWSEP